MTTAGPPPQPASPTRGPRSTTGREPLHRRHGESEDPKSRPRHRKDLDRRRDGSRRVRGRRSPCLGSDLAYPAGLAFDRAGNLYIADSENNRIRRVRVATGVIETFAGTGEWGFSGDGGPALQASLAQPLALALDGDGNLLVADSFNDRVRKVDLGSLVITTIAGSGSQASAGDGGPATLATLRLPVALALDLAGNIFVAEQDGHRVRKIDLSTGLITTVAGTGEAGFTGDGGPATAARLSRPRGLAFDLSGSLYVADAENFRIRRVSAAGVITTYGGTGESGVGGDGGPAAAALFSPAGLANDFDGSGLAVVDLENNRIRRISYDTTNVFTIAGTGEFGYLGDLGPATSAGLRQPWRSAIGPEGDLYIADSEHGRIRRVDRASREISTFAGGGSGPDGGPAESAELNMPSGIAFDAAGNLLIAETWGGRIRKVEKSTGLIRTLAGGGEQLGDGGPATSARLDAPLGVAVDQIGNVFVADGQQNRVRRIDASTGVITTLAGTGAAGYSGDGGLATASTMTRPQDVAVDGSGNLFVSTDDGRIRRVDGGSGIISTYAGGGSSLGDGGPASQAYLDNPSGLALDTTGNLFVADGWGGRVRKVDAGTKVIQTVAGTDIPGFYGDGGRATQAGLSLPQGVAVDTAGNLYIADTNANRIRAVLACVTVAAPVLSAPADGASAGGTSVTLSWNKASGAFRYDVLLDTVNPPVKRLAEKVDETVYTVGNLPRGRPSTGPSRRKAIPTVPPSRPRGPSSAPSRHPAAVPLRRPPRSSHRRLPPRTFRLPPSSRGSLRTAPEATTFTSGPRIRRPPPGRGSPRRRSIPRAPGSRPCCRARRTSGRWPLTRPATGRRPRSRRSARSERPADALPRETSHSPLPPTGRPECRRRRHSRGRRRPTPPPTTSTSGTPRFPVSTSPTSSGPPPPSLD
ncbi:MAG: hypothetical protein IPP07_14430 [Holophagales bacterium]|nr:hypothetical protein [Holophagales bacterium]